MRFDLRYLLRFVPEAVLFALIVFSRWPLLTSGYGSDGDAWRVAFAARELWATGEYVVSRLPGYPLHEIVMAPTGALGGAVASNSATLLAFVAATFIWLRWCRANAANPLILTAAFAFAPLAWIASATTMDYVWSLAFLIASITAAQRSRPISAGLLVGIAAGFRPSNFAFAVVPLVLMLQLPGRRRVMVTFILASLAATLASFLPVLLSFGPIAWWNECLRQLDGVSVPALERTMAAGYRGVYAFGPLAVLTGLAVAVTRRRELLLRWRARDPITLAAIAGIAAYTFAFWLLPAERAYLLPVLPLTLIVLDRIASRGAVVLVSACLVSYAVVNPDMLRHEGLRGVPGFQLRSGFVIEELEKRQAVDRIRAYVGTLEFPDRTIVMTGRTAQAWFDNTTFIPNDTALATIGLAPDRSDRVDVPAYRPERPHLLLVSVLTRDLLRTAKRSGYRVACLPDARPYLEAVGGFRCEEEGVDILPGP